MQCDNCGKEVSPDQNFCRLCGTSLMRNFGASSDDDSISKSELPAAKVTTRVARRRMNRVLLWGLIIVGLGVTVLANAQDYQWINWVGISVFLAGLGLTCYGLFSSEKTLPTGQSSQPGTLNRSKTIPALPGKDNFHPVPSVTERTTELLERKQAHSKTTGHEEAEPE